MTRKFTLSFPIVLPLVILGGLAVASLFFSNRPSYQDLVGSWRGEHRGNILVFRFDSDGTCVLEFLDKSSRATTVVSGNVEVLFSKTPIPLSIRNIPQVNHPLHTIIELQREGVLRMAPPAPRWRLRHISFPPDSMILMRVADNGSDELR